jgi:hypothetical protein
LRQDFWKRTHKEAAAHFGLKVFSTIEEFAMFCECYEFLLHKYQVKIQEHDKAGGLYGVIGNTQEVLIVLSLAWPNQEGGGGVAGVS